MRKKLIALFSMLAFVLAFAFTFSFNAYADEVTPEVEDTPTEEIIPSQETEQEPEDTPIEENTDDLDFVINYLKEIGLTDETIAELITILKTTDSSARMEEITSIIYAEFGIAGLVVLLLLGFVIGFAIKYGQAKLTAANISKETKAILNDGLEALQEKQKEFIEHTKKCINASNDETAKKAAKEAELANSLLDKAIENVK